MNQKEDLPNSWSNSTIGAILRVRNGYAFKSSDYCDSGVPLIRQADLKGRIVDTISAKRLPESYLDEFPNYRVSPGDLLLGMSGSIGKVARYEDEAPALQNQRTGLLVVSDMVDTKFAMMALRFAEPQLLKQGKGIAVQNISAKEIEQSTLPIPPAREQSRIAEKFDELETMLDAGVAALERAKANLNRYRAAVLKAAVEGTLTEEWRAKNPDVEPASELLERILTERRQRWEEEQLAKYKEKGKQPPKGWKEKYKEPAEPDVEGLPELPEGWCWVTVDAIGDVVGGITKGQKRNANQSLREVPYLRVANVQRGYLDLEVIKTIPARESEIEVYRLKKGDILFNEGGDRDKLGRGWVWEDQIEECIHQNHVFRVRPFTSDIQSKLMSHHGNTFGRLWFMRTGKQSVNLASINMTVLRQFPVPLAPVQEQSKIVEISDELLDQIDRCETVVDTQLIRASRLRQSILKRAFEGKLVPQDPDDEPASELLERIKAERETTEVKGKTKKRARKK